MVTESLEIQKPRPSRLTAKSLISSVWGGRSENMMATWHSSKTYPAGGSGNGGGVLRGGAYRREMSKP